MEKSDCWLVVITLIVRVMGLKRRRKLNACVKVKNTSIGNKTKTKIKMGLKGVVQRNKRSRMEVTTAK